MQKTRDSRGFHQVFEGAGRCGQNGVIGADDAFGHLLHVHMK
jgi:hypothetical protein